MLNQTDTIAAISSAAGSGAARVIVRMSGPDASRIAQELLDDPNRDLPAPSTAQLRRLRFRSDVAPVAVTIYRFACGHSATGEDVIELHLPGNALLARLVLDELIVRGARQAEPGEFTARAFFNNRIGLAEAEGIAAAIGAHTQAQLDAARRLMGGELSRRLAPIGEQIVQTLALIEVGIDFADEDVTFIPREEVLARLNDADTKLVALLSESHRFQRLTHEPRVVLAGRPNAGKSTLLNRLAGRERAVVSPLAGTTRDVISAEVALKRGSVRMIDAAGLDEASADRSSDDPIARQMQLASQRALETADVVLLVHDSQDPRAPLAIPRAADLSVATKIDLGDSDRARSFELRVSSLAGTGIAELLERLDVLAFGAAGASIGLALNARHVRAIGEARQALKRASDSIDAGAEVIALELRESLDAIGSILGQVTPDDVLSHVFSAFCIGK